MFRKRLPYDKTVVVDFKVELADLHSRKVVQKGSIAKSVSVDDNFAASDYTVLDTAPVSIPNIKNHISITSFDQFNLALVKDGVQIQTLCNGLFIVQGAFDRVDILVPTGVTKLRVSVVAS